MSVIGIDLGGTNIKASVFDADGVLQEQLTRPTDDAAHFAETIREIARSWPEAQVGLSAPGLAAPDGRSIAYMPGRLHGLENLDWSEWLGRPAQVLNDAHAALLGEIWQGAAKNQRDAVMLTLGTGVGGAIYADGRLLRGHLGRAGHLGHICLDPSAPPDITNIPGSLEDAIGESTVAARSGGRFSSTRELVESYAAGDGDAARIWLASVRALGCGIASIINVVDCEAGILGGGISRAGKHLFDPLARVLDEVEWRPGGARAQILPAQLGEWAGSHGAAWNVWNS